MEHSAFLSAMTWGIQCSSFLVYIYISYFEQITVLSYQKSATGLLACLLHQIQRWPIYP